MKQSALVIATLFAAVQADTKAQEAAKARLQANIKGYLRNGLKFDQKVAQAVHQDILREVKIENKFKDEVRENLKEGHEVADQYRDAVAYEKSQEVYTPPSKANGYWGNIHYNNPQKIMDKWVEAMEDDKELQQDWKEDIEAYARHTQQNHDITADQIQAAWRTNGAKA